MEREKTRKYSQGKAQFLQKSITNQLNNLITILVLLNSCSTHSCRLQFCFLKTTAGIFDKFVEVCFLN